jgi:hypothetical protein
MNSFLVFFYKIFTKACLFSNVPVHSPPPYKCVRTVVTDVINAKTSIPPPTQLARKKVILGTLSYYDLEPNVRQTALSSS